MPIAALTHCLDFDEGHEGVWIRADPVYLRADLGKLLLFDATTFALEREEALGLIQAINTELAHRGLQLSMGKDPARWYLRLPHAPKIKTWSPAAALGQHVDPYLPSGEEGRWWHSLANEVQMALHAADINALREDRGQVPINSVWFWGAGELPKVPESRWTKIWGVDAALQALAELSICPWATLPRHAETLLAEIQDPQGNFLVVLPGATGSLQSIPETHRDDWLRQLEQDWFTPLISMLRGGTFSEIQLICGVYCFTLTRRGSWRVWRPRLSQLPA
jgi:hypothetical protein